MWYNSILTARQSKASTVTRTRAPSYSLSIFGHTTMKFPKKKMVRLSEHQIHFHTLGTIVCVLAFRALFECSAGTNAKKYTRLVSSLAWKKNQRSFSVIHRIRCSWIRRGQIKGANAGVWLNYITAIKPKWKSAQPFRIIRLLILHLFYLFLFFRCLVLVFNVPLCMHLDLLIELDDLISYIGLGFALTPTIKSDLIWHTSKLIAQLSTHFICKDSIHVCVCGVYLL